MGRKISIGSEVDFLAVVQRGGCKRIRLQACGSCPPASWLLHANAFSESIFFCSTHTERGRESEGTRIFFFVPHTLIHAIFFGTTLPCPPSPTDPVPAGPRTAGRPRTRHLARKFGILDAQNTRGSHTPPPSPFFACDRMIPRSSGLGGVKKSVTIPGVARPPGATSWPRAGGVHLGLKGGASRAMGDIAYYI